MQKSKFEKARVELDAGISKLNGLGKKAKEEKVKEVSIFFVLNVYIIVIHFTYASPICTCI